jgi:hypothetical protein
MAYVLRGTIVTIAQLSTVNCQLSTVKGGENMAYDTKVALSAAAQSVARSKTLKEAYAGIAMMANVEGVQLPSYEDARTHFEELRREPQESVQN